MEAAQARLARRKALVQLMPQQPQRQDDLSNQLLDLRAIANRCGLYDAADYLRNTLNLP